MAVTYVCDFCKKFKSQNIDDFRVIHEQKKVKNELITFYLCEEKCFKLYRMVWKVLSKLNSNWTFSKLEEAFNKLII